MYRTQHKSCTKTPFHQTKLYVLRLTCQFKVEKMNVLGTGAIYFTKPNQIFKNRDIKVNCLLFEFFKRSILDLCVYVKASGILGYVMSCVLCFVCSDGITNVYMH